MRRGEGILDSYISKYPQDYVSSVGEDLIASYFDLMGVEYLREVVFERLPFLRFDFYLPKYKIAVEYDGRQHFEVVSDFGDTEDDLSRRKKFDRLKNIFIFKNGGKLIRVKHDQDAITFLHSKLLKYYPDFFSCKVDSFSEKTETDCHSLADGTNLESTEKT